MARRTQLPRRSVRFRIPTRYATLMKSHGVGLAILANNHAEDCGLHGVADTVSALDAANIAHVGASSTGSPFISRQLRVNGHQIIVWSVTIFRNLGKPKPERFLPVAYKPYREVQTWLPQRVLETRKKYPNALIMVSLHWGKEWSQKPSPGQIRLARELVDHGANVIMGHHPHVLQPVQVYKDAAIFYSTGNLVFDMIGHEGRRSAIFQVRLSQAESGRWCTEEITIHPIKLQKLKRGPRPADVTEARRILEPVRRASAGRFQTPLVWKGKRLVWQR